jgi:O-antigen biosynthesis protein
VIGGATEADRRVPTGERFDPLFMGGRMIEAEHLARYSWACGFASGKRVLDAACGMAYGSRMLLDAGAAEVVGVDIAEEVIADLRSLGGPRLRFEVADLRHLPFGDDEFDLITCFEAIEHVAEPELVLDELRRVLRPGGLLAISTPNRDVYNPGNPFHLRELTPSELGEELGLRFGTVVIRRQHTYVASGIFDDAAFLTGGNSRIGALNVFKACENEPGKETYTLALASDGEIPDDTGILDLSADVDLREWSERLSLADQVIERVPRDADLVQLAELESLRGEIAGLRRQLARSEEEIARYVDLQERLEETDEMLSDYVRSADLANSLSWRVTEPLRRFMAALRALKGRISRA